MGPLNPFVAQHQQRSPAGRGGRHPGTLSEFYGDSVPATAYLLDDYLRAGRIPLRDPDCADRVVTVDLQQAAAAFGGQLADTRCHLHRMHAAGLLTIDQFGTVDLRMT